MLSVSTSCWLNSLSMNTYIGSAKYEYVTSLRSSWIDVELLVGAVDGLRAAAGQQVLELHLDDRRVAAGLREFGLLHDHRVLADHDHVAGADFLGDFHDDSWSERPIEDEAAGQLGNL